MMATAEYQGGTGGKIRKQPMRRKVPSTPYDSPPSTSSGWFSKLIDPAARLIVRSTSRLFSSIFHTSSSTNEEIPKIKASPEVKEQGDNFVDIKLSFHYDGINLSEQELCSRLDAIFQIEQLISQENLSRVEIDRLSALLHSRIEPSYLWLGDYKNKGNIKDDSNINLKESLDHSKPPKTPASTLDLNAAVCLPVRARLAPIQPAGVWRETEARNCCGGTGAWTRFAETEFSLRAYRRSRWNTGREVGPKRLETEFSHRTAKPPRAKQSLSPADSGNKYMIRKPRGRSTSYKFSRSPSCKLFRMTNPKEYNLHQNNIVDPPKLLKLIQPPLFNVMHSGHRQTLKRGRSDRDVGCLGDHARRRVRQKSYLQNFDLSTFYLGQKHKVGNDLKGPDNQECRISSQSFPNTPPPRSVEMARKILRQLDGE